jgi:hypothetical protein
LEVFGGVAGGWPPASARPLSSEEVGETAAFTVPAVTMRRGAPAERRVSGGALVGLEAGARDTHRV